jgi:geranylgeranyl diphosphate synthase type I
MIGAIPVGVRTGLAGPPTTASTVAASTVAASTVAAAGPVAAGLPSAGLPLTLDGAAAPPVLCDGLRFEWAGEQGLLGEMCRHALGSPGKLFRPILLLQSAQAVGGRAEHVLPAAIGTEIGHVASLVHDDIIDADEIRRGQPAVHAKFGEGNAIVAGDAMIFDLFRCLAECRTAGAHDSRIVTALEIVSQAGIDLCRGQSLEFELTSAASHDLDRYIEMIKLKTGALFNGACRVGAVLGGGSDEAIDALGRYGYELGIAFQMCDDLLTYTGGSDEAIGKSILSDIRNKRMTLPIILAYRDGAAEIERELDEALDPRLDLAMARRTITGVLSRHGVLDSARDLALTHASLARDSLNVLAPTPSRDCLADYADRAINRIR